MSAKRKFEGGASKLRKQKLKQQVRDSCAKIENYFVEDTKEKVTENLDEASSSHTTVLKKSDINVETHAGEKLHITVKIEETIVSDDNMQKNFTENKTNYTRIDNELNISDWPQIITDFFINQILLNKPKSDVIIENNVKKLYGEGETQYYRYLIENNFYLVKPNGQKQKREWLVYSAKSNCVYCYPCKLFSLQENSLRSLAFRGSNEDFSETEEII